MAHRSLQWLEITPLLLFLARLWLSSPIHSCIAVFLAQRHGYSLSDVRAKFEWVLVWSVCKIGNACGLHQYLRGLCLCVREGRRTNESVCVCVREGIFKPHLWLYSMCVYVCSRQEVGSIASRCWRRSRNSLNSLSLSLSFPCTNTQVKVQWVPWKLISPATESLICQTKMSPLSTNFENQTREFQWNTP